uniref:OCA domain-containing protein n=1 Tax=Tetraodon nigroviridis TaxID=99883 RepID=H3DA45_TETNG
SLSLGSLAPPAALARPKPYQGVRVRDPVKELLRRKRSLEVQGSKRAPPAVSWLRPVANEAWLTPNSPVCPSGWTRRASATVATAARVLCNADGGEQWKPAPVTAGLPLGAASWSPADCGQQDGSAAAAYSAAPALAADVYMQTLCPSYAMLTYAPTPLLTNLGGLPVAPAPASLPQVELPDSGLTYLPWAPPLATISTTPNPGLQFAAGATLPGSPLVHVPLSM